MKRTRRLKQLTLSALVGIGLLASPASAAPNSVEGEVLIGFRATAGVGQTTNYVIDLGQVADLKALTQVTIFPQTGVAQDLNSVYGATWHSRTDLFWGAVAATGNFSPVGDDPAKTLYATKAETTNGTLATAWARKGDTAQGSVVSRVSSVRSTFNDSSRSTPATNAATDTAVTMTTSALNSWSAYQPGGSSSSGIGFGMWSPQIDGNPAKYLDLFRMTVGSGDPPGELVGRMVLNSNGSITFVPAAIVGLNVVQLSAATYTAAENIGGGMLDVTVTRTGDTSIAATVTLSTTDGTAVAPTDFTAQSSQSVNFAVGESSKVVSIPIVNRPGTQADRSFTLTLGGATGGTTLGTQSSATGTITDASIPSQIALASAVFTANQGATSVTINFVRTGGSDAVTFNLNATEDSAVAGSDYTAPSGLFTIPANLNTASATITLLPRAVSSHLQFNISMANPSGDNTLGTLTSGVVRILTSDLNKPVVSIISPLANASINGNNGNPVNVLGTATDDKGVIDRVEVRLNGGAPVNATLVSTSSGASYSLSVAPVGGLNTISVQAFDARGNFSAVVTRSFTYVVKRAITLAISPNSTAGSVTGLKAGDAYQVGMPITLTAKAAANFIFDRWSGTGLSGSALEVPALNINMTAAFASSHPTSPTLTAHFVPNPFVASVIGEFNGLVVADGSSIPSNATNGMISTLKVTGTGTFTGTLKIDGLSLALSGLFDNTGVAKFGPARTTTLLVERPTKSSYELSLTLDLAPAGTNRITGTLKQRRRSALVSNSIVTLDRAFFSITNPLAANYLVNKGIYNVTFPARATQVGLSAADYPQGDGVGSLTVTNIGQASLAATLADGTAVTASAPLSKNRAVPLFAQLYAAKAGSMGGVATLDDTQLHTDVAGVDFFWFRPWQKGHYYPWGWDEGIKVDLAGTKFAVPLGASVVPLLPNTIPNATLTFTDGLLASAIAKNVTITATNAVVNAPLPGESVPDPTFSLAVTAAKGTISGTFTHSDGTKPKFNGVILQKGDNRAAFGYFLTTQPTIITGLGESGSVSLLHQ